MDTCLADAQRQYGQISADHNILAFVDAYAKMNGFLEKRKQAQDHLELFCQAGKKTSPKSQQGSPKIQMPIAAIPKPDPAQTSVPVTKG